MASIQFNTSKEVVSEDGQALNRIVNSTGGGASLGVRVNESAGKVTRATVGPGGEVVVDTSSRQSSVNMGALPNGETGLLASAKRAGTPVAAADLRDSDLIIVPGLGEVTVGVAKRVGLLSTDPATKHTTNATEASLREASGEAEAERQATAEAAAQAATAEQVSLNTHPVSEIEDAHSSFVSSVPVSDQISALIQLQNTGKLNTATLSRVSEAMGVQPDVAVDQLNAMSLGVQMQFKTLAAARGVDPDAAADWIRGHRPTQVMSALQRHALTRDVVGAWSGLLNEYKRATGAGRNG